MAKFSQKTLTQVAGFDGQILAQELVYDQKDFWNFAWNSTDSQGNTTPVDLTGATINAQIIRRAIVGLEDSRSGISFDIFDYPLIYPITSVSATTATGNILTCLLTTALFVDQPIKFTGTTFGNIVYGTTYYVKQILTATTFTISATQSGTEFVLADATGIMIAERIAPTAITLPIVNRVDAAGTFTMVIDDDVWGIMAGDPELNISASDPVCFTGRIKLSFPAVGTQPAYDDGVFLLFLITTDGVVN